MRRLRVGMDLDGVNFWFHRSYYRGCKLLGILPAAAPFQEATCWNFYDAYDHNLAAFIANCNDLADAGLLWDGDMIPGAKSMWDAILDGGHELHVKTDRAFGTHPVASEVATVMWLSRHKRHYHSLTFGADKAAGPAVDIMLDDKLENYDALDAAGVRVYLINRLWNADPGDTRRRVNTHQQFLSAVYSMASEPAEALVG